MRWEGTWDFDRLSRSLADSRPNGLMKAAEHVRQVSSVLAPKENGVLAGSADVRLTGDGQATITYPGPYARYQEFGVFWRMKPRPSPHNGEPLRHDNGQSFFLTSSMRSEHDRCIQIMADEIWRGMSE